ncbi:MAG: deaminase [Nitrospirota bacterium]
MGSQKEIKFMKLAIQEAKRSQREDTRPHPYVGAVVVRDDQILASSCRGDLAQGDHAEFSVLEKKLPHETLAGCTVYTTLEPCTTRHHPKQPCAERLIARKVGRVVIGMLDPDQRITGKGVLCLRRAGIAVDLFPPNLMAELEEPNRDFTKDPKVELLHRQVKVLKKPV